MKRFGVDGGFLLCLGLNLVMNLSWTIPAWIALVLHFVLGISLLWFFAGLGLWFLIILLITMFLGFIVSTPTDFNRQPSAEEKARKREEIREYSRNIKNMNK